MGIFHRVPTTDVLELQFSSNFTLPEASSITPEWNFYKYLVNGSGKVVGAWGTRTTIEEIFDEIQAEVEKAKEVAAGGPLPGVDSSTKDEL